MSRAIRPGRGLLGLLVLGILVALVALPTMAAEPTPSPKPGKGPKPDKVPGTPVTLTGTVATRTDADGRIEYTMTAGGRTLVLDGGPTWFFGDDHPLKAYVGKSVTITGSQRAGEDEVDVEAVDGQALRAAGKPPWAGGWKRVGSRHPGWTQEKADRWQAKRAAKAQQFGVDCFPRGQCKERPNQDRTGGN
jgi:hypothetical protein